MASPLGIPSPPRQTGVWAQRPAEKEKAVRRADDAIERLQEEMAESLGGFKLVRHKLELYGVCAKYAGVRNGQCPNES